MNIHIFVFGPSSISRSIKRSIQCFLISFLPLLTSCIRDELAPCPPLQVDIAVKDKNYFNVNNVQPESHKSESLPFREYVSTLYYTLRNATSGEIIEEQGVFDVTGSETIQSITFCDCLPLGKYALTVWGGMPDNSLLTNNSLTAILHANQMEGKDIYLAHDTLVYDNEHAHHTINLERTTGKLLIEIIDLPSTVRYSTNSTTQIYERINHLFNYMNSVTVNKQNTWNPASTIMLNAILAPSKGDKQSTVHLNLYNEAERITPVFTPKDVNITLKRNELTRLKYVYDDNKEDFNIYLLVDDAWETIYSLDIN